ncbi:DNA ligase D [Piscinibacter koreensis]|uniref:DNA ligase (ATP) n=1 Tax=Piscinibacter koreensis TaxID=2742824 RepID=A0A7Y6NR77_9BURK|nr:DNA ligase D [Schlegelella koreensis]NUZ07853.1 DNA ligase D [Schlegelella koreensis]
MAEPPRPAAPLARYRQKRDFGRTPEPAGDPAARSAGTSPSFVIQKHWASRLHYDFRLEWDGVLLSWAVPKGPSFDPAEKRIAVHVEDHPLGYASFEGTIPPKQYGAGRVIVWDRGTWEPVGDPAAGMRDGKLVFRLHGEKLAGLWELVRIAKPGDRQDTWILFKKRDAWARALADYDVIAALPDSVVATPLGPVEAREPRDACAAPARVDRIDVDVAGAPRSALPRRLAPQLATLAAAPPDGAGWIVETKLDGYRLMSRVENGRARLITRGGHDWTDRLAPVAAALEALATGDAWLDGEIVVMGAGGVPDFNALQSAIDGGAPDKIEYFVFDAPFLDGRDLRALPLAERRAALRRVFAAAPPSAVRFSEDFPATPAQMLEAACRMKLEGVIAKRADAPYVSARTTTWLKLKCARRQEFVICGFTDRSGAKDEVGSLILGYHANGVLRYAGNVGTGWDGRTGSALHRRLVAIEVATPTLDPEAVKPGRWSKRSAGGERWVEPVLVAEVAFTDWTPDGHVRHPLFKALRDDKDAAEVTREDAEAVPVVAAPTTPPMPKAPSVAARTTAAAAPGRARGPAAPLKISNPERVIDASTGLKKRDLLHYYESVAERMLPHLAARPVSLVRAPDGIGGELFFQKHPETRLPGLRVMADGLWPGHGRLLAIDDADALLAAAQMNTIEFHTWNSTETRIDKPDRVVFDLDPGEGVSWAHLQEAALLTRTLLAELGLESWLKTSGGKGLHVVAPITPRHVDAVVSDLARAVVLHLAKTIPSRFVAKSGAANRVGRIFVDWIRNRRAQTTAVAFSARARPGLGVSMPVPWDELMALKGGAQWTIATAREHLSFERDDPWAGYWSARQTLTRAMKTLGVDPARS